MSDFIIVHDSNEKTEVGDFRVYDSEAMALRSLEKSDAFDENIRVYDGNGNILKICYDVSGTVVSLDKTENFFAKFIDVLNRAAIMANISNHTINETNSSLLLSDLYNKNPNPYA